MADVNKLAPFIEEWRYIDGYEGMYMVSNRGNVRDITFVVMKENYTEKGVTYLLV